MKGQHLSTRTGDVVRQDLLRALPAAGGDDRLLVVSAPGGWGKTTMLGTWDSWSTDTNFCWLPLAAPDNDPTRFINRLVGAAGPLLGPGDRDWPDPGASSPMVWVDEALPLFLEAVQLDAPAAIVLDDYHLIENPETHGVVQAMIERAGPGLLTVISTRIDPPLRLARLRAARTVQEIRSDELEFSADDADLLLRQSFGLQLDREQVRRLVETTGGWPAAISLAAQSLRTVNDPDEFLARFVATDRLVVDYLTEELLDTLSADHRRFLRDTSVVEDLVPDLAATLSDQTDAAEIADDLERRGLLRRTYEGDRLYFRFHQLLRDALYQGLDPEHRRTRHVAAADWYLATGQPRSAIDQLIGAGETDRAATLIASHAGSYLLRGRYRTVEGWVATIGEQQRLAPGLSLIGALASLYAGRVGQAAAWHLAAVDTDGELEPPDQLLALAIETMLQLAAGRTSDATGVADRLLDYERGIDPTQVEAGIYAEALFVAALPYCLDGRYDEAEANLNRSIAAARGGSSQVPTVACLGMQALLRVLAEDPAGAAVLATESLELTAELQLPQTALHTSPAHLVRVLTGTENQAREALEHLSKICDQIYLPYAVVAANLAEARFQMRIDDLERAQRALVAGRDLFDELEQPSDLLTRYYRVVTEAVPGQQPVPRPPGPEALTDRELQVLRAFSSNLTQREIGRELFLSFNTIKTYARSAYRKLGVSSRTEAVRACREAGLF